MSDYSSGSAFPYSYLTPEGPQVYEDSKGMTLRDYFAAAALIGLIVRNREGEHLASAAYEVADAMLKERAK